MAAGLNSVEVGSDPIGLLVKSGQVDQEAVARARRLSSESGETVFLALTRLGIVSESDMAAAFSRALDLPRLDVRTLPADASLCNGISADFLRHARVLSLVGPPFGEFIALAMANPSDEAAVEAIALFVEKPVRRYALG